MLVRAHPYSLKYNPPVLVDFTLDLRNTSVYSSLTL